jgi:pimeloyl-ACP methyl ester carboxylesterase
VNGQRHYLEYVDTHADDLQPASLSAGGFEISYLEAGPENGQLVICLHGFPDTAWTWRHLLPVLAGAGYHAVAPFLRGYAPTGLAPDGSYQTGALATDACAVEEALGGSGPSIVVGHDWGAFAAYGAAVLRPERFEKVVGMVLPPLPATGPKFFSYDQIRRLFYVFFFQSPLAEAVVGADDSEFLVRLWADWSPAYDASWDLDRVKESIGSPERLAAAISYYRAMFDTTKHLPKYEEAQQAASGAPSQPTLYFHGTDDGCMGIELTDLVDSVLPEGSRSVIVAGAGHFLHLESPGSVNEDVLRFLDS